MKKVVVFLLLAGFFCSCKSVNSLLFDASPGGHYRFKYELLKPIANQEPVFSDDKIEASFDMTTKGLNFVIKNKTNETMKVMWDEASMVVGGKAEKITHSGIRYMEKAGSQPPTTIPSGASLDDFVVPISNIYYREGFYSSYVSVSGGWETSSIIPDRDHNRPELKEKILGMKGTTFSFYLPILYQGATLEYLFEFRITEVETIEKKSGSAIGTSK